MRRQNPTGLIHGPFVRNPKAPSDLFDSWLDLAYAGTHPETNIAVDGSGLGNDAVLTGYADVPAGWRFTPELDRWGTNHTSGGSDHVLIASARMPLAREARSFACWMYQRSRTSGVQNALFDQVRTSTNQSFTIQSFLFNSKTYLFTNSVNSNNNVELTGAEIPSLNVWNHIGFTFDGADTYIYYLNGRLTKTGTFGTAINTVASNLLVGRRTSAEAGNFDGIIVDALGYSFVLPQPLIEWHANPANRLYVADTRKVFSPPPPPPPIPLDWFPQIQFPQYSFPQRQWHEDQWPKGSIDSTIELPVLQIVI